MQKIENVKECRTSKQHKKWLAKQEERGIPQTQWGRR